VWKTRDKGNVCNSSLGKQKNWGDCDGAIECFTPRQQLQKMMFYLKYQTANKRGVFKGGLPGGSRPGIKITMQQQ